MTDCAHFKFKMRVRTESVALGICEANCLTCNAITILMCMNETLEGDMGRNYTCSVCAGDEFSFGKKIAPILRVQGNFPPDVYEVICVGCNEVLPFTIIGYCIKGEVC